MSPFCALGGHPPLDPLVPPCADGSLDVAVRPGRIDWHSIVADLSIASPGLCRGLFEIYLGGSSGATPMRLFYVGLPASCLSCRTSLCLDPCLLAQSCPTRAKSGPPAPASCWTATTCAAKLARAAAVDRGGQCMPGEDELYVMKAGVVKCVPDGQPCVRGAAALAATAHKHKSFALPSPLVAPLLICALLSIKAGSSWGLLQSCCHSGRLSGKPSLLLDNSQRLRRQTAEKQKRTPLSLLQHAAHHSPPQSTALCVKCRILLQTAAADNQPQDNHRRRQRRRRGRVDGLPLMDDLNNRHAGWLMPRQHLLHSPLVMT